MKRTFLTLAFAALAIFGFGLTGCSNPDSTTEDPASTTEADDHDHDEDGHKHDETTGKTEAEKIAEGLAKLSDADRASAEKQQTCVITGEMLGEEGMPVKVNVNEMVVWVCCEGCKNDLLSDPEKYLAKLNK